MRQTSLFLFTFPIALAIGLIFTIGSLPGEDYPPPGQFQFGPDKTSFQSLFLSGMFITRENNGNYFLQLKKENKIQSELFLDFENAQPSNLKDKSNHYKILKSTYNIEDKKAPQGKRYASFSGKDTMIKISADKSRLLGSSYFTEDFFIAFYLRAENTEDDAIIMSREYITAGRVFGLTFRLRHGFLQTELNNLFYYKTKTKSALLKTNTKLTPDQWHLATLYIESASGIAVLYLDGVEIDRIAITGNEDESMSLGFHPHDTTPLTIGNEFYGSLDMLMIGKGKPDFETLLPKYPQASYKDYAKTTDQDLGMAISPVLKTAYSHSLPLTFKQKVNVPEGTNIEQYVRFSEMPFQKDSEMPTWIPVDKFKNLNPKPDFRFFQLMIKMKSNYNGTLTPKLYSSKLTYAQTLPPITPSGLKILSIDQDNQKICLSWNENNEGNVRNGGGYIIHYGVSPERMVASLYVNENGEKITGITMEHSKDKQRIQCIQNDLIALNAEKEKDKNLLTFQKGITYYFKISAYNNKFDQAKSPDQKSRATNAVYASFRSL